ncbi:unnamed protein product [Prunus brigantina]
MQKNRWGLTEFPSLRSPSSGHQIGHAPGHQLTRRRDLLKVQQARTSSDRRAS